MKSNYFLKANFYIYTDIRSQVLTSRFEAILKANNLVQGKISVSQSV